VSLRGRVALGLVCAAMLALVGPGASGAQEAFRELSLTPEERAWPRYRLVADDGNRTDCWRPGLTLAAAEDSPASDVPRAGAGPAEPPAPTAEKKPRWLLAGLVAFGEIAVTAAKATITFDHTSFNVKDEGLFGTNTEFGGADKASHFADYYVITKEFSFIYGKLGLSDTAARLLAAGTAFTGGLVNEIADGFTKYGFSWGDLLMDGLGTGAALLILTARLDDLVGFRTSHFGSYQHDVYAMDLKLAGLARRLNINIGPLRYLYLSGTYGVKGYPTNDVEERQRQLGIEIGLSLEEILNSAGARRDTWWGATLHILGDNIRFPFTAVGFRFDLNHSKWHGPNSGNWP
jgi:Predicted periplasmic lipoprotein (DUF2279)